MHDKEEEKMPNVKKNRNAGGMKFPSTKEGMAQAKQYSMQSGGKVELDKMEMGGMVKEYLHGGMVHSPMMSPMMQGGMSYKKGGKVEMDKMMGGGKIHYGKKKMPHGGKVHGKKKMGGGGMVYGKKKK